MPLRLESDAPLITFGGAGTGKCRDLLAFNFGMRTRDGWTAPPRVFGNDPRGELAKTFMLNAVRFMRPCRFINPFSLHGLPSDRLNVWGHLNPDALTFHVDVKAAVNDLLPRSLGRGENEYFELRALDWAEALVKHDCQRYGSITMPAFHERVNSIEDPLSTASFSDGRTERNNHVR
jgi:type IV secretion system protein VirD4